MRIGFNLLPYSAGQHGGAEVYFRNVIEALQSSSRSHELFLIGEGDTAEQYCANSHNSYSVPISWSGKKSRLARSLAEQFVLPLVCARYRLDCLVSNYVSPLVTPCKTVTIVHDMLYRRYPQVLERAKLLYWRIMLPQTISRSNAVVAVSKFSAEEIVSLFPRARKKVFVTVEGVRPSFAEASPDDSMQERIEGKYLLCVATFGKHKNLHMLLRAFAALPESYQDVTLVFAGAARTADAKQYQVELKQTAEQFNLSPRVVFTGHVSDGELAWLYKNAIACVLPSLYEGFGLPIIEAQHFGCPVICSDRASLPEIAGQTALKFDPTSVDSIRDALVMLLANRELSAHLRQAGYENALKYSWEKAAAQLSQAIEYAVQHG